MKIRTLAVLLVAAAVISPSAIAKKKKKTKKTPQTPIKVISISNDKITIVQKSEEKTYAITKDTKVFNKRQEEVKAAELEGTRFVLLTFSETEPNVLVKIQEYVMAPTKPEKTKKKKK